MDGVLISWRIANASGEVEKHPVHRYPLGLDMWWQDYKLDYLPPSDPRRNQDLRLVSSTLMKMVSRRTENGRVLRIKGKQSPQMGLDYPWQYLNWQYDDGTVPAHHILARFGPVTWPTDNIRKPGPNCPTVMQYLLHETDLLQSPDEPTTHDHRYCAFSIPIGIFWGLVGLRSLNKWYIVRDLVEHGLWFHQNGGPNFDPEPYQPVVGVLPRNLYLKIWIAVGRGRILRHCYFRFKHRGEVLIDDPAIDDDDDDAQGELYNPESGDETHSGSGDGGSLDNRWQDRAMVVHRPRDEDISYSSRSKPSKPSRRRTGPDVYGSYSRSTDVMMMSPPPFAGSEHFSPKKLQRRRTVDVDEHPGALPIPEDLKLEELCIGEEVIIPKDELVLRQRQEDHEDLLDCGTGLPLESLPSWSFEEKSMQLSRHRHHSRDQYPEEKQGRYVTDSDDPEDLDEDYSSEDQRRGSSQGDHPIIIGEERSYYPRREDAPSQYDAYHEPQRIPRRSYNVYPRESRPHRHHSNRPLYPEPHDEEDVEGSPGSGSHYHDDRHHLEYGDDDAGEVFFAPHEADNIARYNYGGQEQYPGWDDRRSRR